jgi:hypothetical protein
MNARTLLRLDRLKSAIKLIPTSSTRGLNLVQSTLGQCH